RCFVFQQKWKSGRELRNVLKCGDNVTLLRVAVTPIRLKPPVILLSTDERPSIIELGQSADPDWSLFLSKYESLPAVIVGAGVAMETVVIVAIGVLATIFLASFIALVMVCRHRYCHPHDLLHHFDSKPTVDLIGAMETQSEPSELELDDVVITNPHIEAILENEDWIEDASGLVSHCISILKICHTLTEKLVAMTMGSGAKVKAPASLSDIITVAKRISPRVDDVVRSMYPPLDPILLDAR
ncbi:Transmembrane protein 98, partial [Nibea albiflora]